MYGTQTYGGADTPKWLFENDVKMYGTQTAFTQAADVIVFENDVKMYGTQTRKSIHCPFVCLRMM